MATFLENLWNSIFTPGPTPTLLVATNATFGALQLLLLALLLATHSIHFLILSGLSAGLWWSINWFASEIRAAQQKEEEAKRIRDARKAKEKEGKEKGRTGSEGEGMDTGDDTEVETEVEEKQRAGKVKQKERKREREETQSTVLVERPDAEQRATVPAPAPLPVVPIQAPRTAASASATGSANMLAPEHGLKSRRAMGESVSELSTDSEWERVSEDSGERS